ncbi:signal peptidase II [bacterium]|nr:signal peptidase II [bacterium]
MKKLWLFGMILIACVGCDQTTKSLAKKHLNPFEMHSYFYDTLRLQYVENTGAMYGMGSGLTATTGMWLLIIVPSAILLTLLMFMFISNHLTHLQFIALALVFAGGTGNMIDRIFNERSVVDFLNIGVGEFRTAIFNLADMNVMIGVALLITVQFFIRRHNLSQLN